MTKEIFASYRDFYRHQLLDDCIPFWEHSDLLDRKFGGYITSVDREGKSYNDDKSVWFQGRCLWTFSALMNRYGKKAAWEEGAEIGKGFLEKFCTDADGRMFFTVTQDGRPLRKRRYMFSESFYVVSMAEYAAATGDAEALRKAEECFELMLRLYRTPESDPYKITPKTYASTRADRASAVPMVLVSSAQLLRRCDPAKADYYTKVTNEMVDAIIDYHYKPERKCVLECVGPNGEFIDNPAGRCVNPGHSMENSWFLMNEAIYSGNKALLEKALNILDWSLELGWDKQYGGFIPGIRAGNATSRYLTYVMNRLNTVGAVYLLFVALIPTVLIMALGLNAKLPFGGTTILIIAGVGLDTLRQAKAQTEQFQYTGFLFENVDHKEG